MSIEAALEIYSTIFGKDPAGTEYITYAEVVQFLEETTPKYRMANREFPIERATIPTDDDEIWHHVGVADQAEMEAFLDNMDLNDDGLYDYSEWCRQFVHDSDWVCGGDRISSPRDVT